jgi:hypothetical protein
LLARPRLNDTDLDSSEIAALRDLAAYRSGKLRFVAHEGWNAIREAAAAKIANGTRTNLKVSGDETTTTETTREPSGDAVRTSLDDIDDALRQEISRLVEAMKQDAARAGMDRTGVYPPRTVPNDLDLEHTLLQKWHDQNGICALCDKRILLNPTNKLLQLSRDRADSANKIYDWQNTQLTHLACNLGKSDATADEWQYYLAMVRQPSPH